MTTTKEIIELTRQLVEIPSVSGDLHELQRAFAFVLTLLKNSGRNITIEQFESNGRPSLLAYKGPARPDNFRIILNGHLDVVAARPAIFRLTQKNGRLYGRGVYDMKTAIIVMIKVFLEFVDRVPYPLALQLVTDEEVGGYDGADYQIKQGVRGDFVISGECGITPQDRGIANETKGIIWITLGFRGSPAHAGHLWKGENAILKASRFAHAILERYPTPAEAQDVTTVNIASIDSGNNSQNQVPDFATMKLDIRFVAGDPNFQNRSSLAALIADIDPHAEIIDVPVLDAPFYSSPDNPLLIALKKAAETVEGKPFRLVSQHGSSDARLYGNIGVEACEFGVAGEHQHSDKEYVPIKAVENYYRSLQLFLESTTTN